MSLGEYKSRGAADTRLLLHLNGNATDSSGNGNNGTEYNITYVNGRLGKYASFNGTNSGIKVLNHSSLNFGNQCTFSAWFKTEAINGITQVIATKWGTSAAQYQYSFVISGLDSILLTLRSWGNNYQVFDTETVRVGIWQNAIVSCDSTTMRLYVDGVYKNSKSWTGTINIPASPPNLGVGYLPDNGTLSFNGLIDEVIIESRAWSHSEIKRYYTNTLGKFATI